MNKVFKFKAISKNNQYSNLVTRFNYRSFVLYIPSKKLLFKTHHKHGEVYPVYIADEEFNRKNNPKKLMPLIILFSSFNLFLFLTGMQIMPITSLYDYVWINESFILGLIGTNIYLVRQYLNYLIQYHRRVKNLFLLKNGTQIIIETFDGDESKVEILDIYQRNIKLIYEDEKNKILDNDNSFKAVINWGAARENHLEGKRILLDTEIFKFISHRHNIETTETKFKEVMPLNTYSSEEKKQILDKTKGRTVIKLPKFTSANYYALKYHIPKLKSKL